MSANVINGTDLCLFITTGSTKKCIALATTCKIGVTMSTRKIASKDSGIWEDSAVGRMSWTCDSDQLFTQDFSGVSQTGTTANTANSGFTYDSLMDLMIARTPIVITVGAVTTSGMGYQQTLGTGRNLTGTALITKLDLNAKDNDNATYTITMEGTGALTHA